MEWRIGEIYHPGTANYEPGTPWKYEIEHVWESGELSSFNSVLDFSGAGLEVGHTYRARVRMQDAAGRWSHWSAPLEFQPGAPLSTPTLAVTELHYHPNNPNLLDESDQEFIEIQNIGDQTVDLSGVQIAAFAGEPYVFGDDLSLAPGEHIVVARTPAVFTSIYGTGINLAPDGYANANFSNQGETITLLDAGGAQILSFTYDDATPWPESPDGDGPSLEIIDPRGDPNNPANWRASAADGGTPGRDSGSPPVLAGDYDRSGVVNQQDYNVWRSQFGMSVPSAGDGADGNRDGTVDLADYVVWRNNLSATSAGIRAAESASLGAGAAVLADSSFFRLGSEPPGDAALERGGVMAPLTALPASQRNVVPRRPSFAAAVSHGARDQAILELLVDSIGRGRRSERGTAAAGHTLSRYVADAAADDNQRYANLNDPIVYAVHEISDEALVQFLH
jgi:hypothetical protein